MTPLADTVFPTYVRYDNLYFKLISHHIPPAPGRDTLLDRLRREAADDGDWEMIAEGIWGAAMESQRRWDAMMADPVAYAVEMDRLKMSSISAGCHRLAMEDLVAHREDRSQCDWMPAVREFLAEHGCKDDPRYAYLLEKLEDELEVMRASAGTSLLQGLMDQSDEEGWQKTEDEDDEDE